MDQTALLQWLTSQQHPVLDQAAKIITILGGEDFYLFAIPIIYWCFSKRIGFRLFYVFALSMFVNSYLKSAFGNPRPVGTEGIRSVFTETAASGYGYPNDSFPSGHTQGTTTFWLYLASVAGKPLLWVPAALMIVLVSLSRMYLGLHWPMDVLGGLGVGLAIFVLAVLFERLFPYPPLLLKVLGLILLPIALALWFPVPDAAKVTGVMLGAGLGHLLEEGRIKMGLPAGWFNRVVAFAIGIAGVLLLKSVLKTVLPAGLLYDFLRYGCMGLWITGIAPWIFVVTRLYGREGRSYRHFP